MKRSFWQVGVPLAAASMVVGAAAAANAQGQEYVVDSRVVSDVVIDSSSGSEGYVGDLPTDSVADCNGEGSNGSDGQGRGGLGFAGLGGGSLYRQLHPINGGPVNRRYGRPDLFYNNYTQGYYNRANAQMYLSPLPVPPHVGHTFFTYQPFYPEEMLYWHKNRFHTYFDDGRGMNRTRATYYSPPIRQAASNLYWNYLRIPR